MTTKKLTKLLALYLPYILLGLVATNIGEAWRLAEGKELGDKIMAMMGTVPVAFANPLPSLHPLDLLVGLCCGAGLRLAVYLRGKNAAVLADLRDALFGVVKNPPRFRQRKRPRRAVEEFGTDVLFESLHILRERGLRNLESCRGARNAAGLKNGGEIAEGLRVHAGSRKIRCGES